MTELCKHCRILSLCIKVNYINTTVELRTTPEKPHLVDFPWTSVQACR